MYYAAILHPTGLDDQRFRPSARILGSSYPAARQQFRIHCSWPSIGSERIFLVRRSSPGWLGFIMTNRNHSSSTLMHLRATKRPGCRLIRLAAIARDAGVLRVDRSSLGKEEIMDLLGEGC